MFDIIIVGGGLAGLSLATRLCDPSFSHLRVLVLESRRQYGRDKTWCHWQVTPSPFDKAVSHRWNKWAVTNLGSTHTCESAEHSYAMIPSDRLYEIALQRIIQSDNVSLSSDSAVLSLVVHDTFVDVVTKAASIRGGLVFDGRPQPRHSNSGLTQTFAGFEIETDQDAFDVSVATLMDFVAVPAEVAAVNFMYLLPLSPTRALIEDTWFIPAGAHPYPVTDPASTISTYLADRWGVKNYRVIYRESGRLAMDTGSRRPRNSPRVVPIGTGANMSRASSGYAFDEIQRGCERLLGDIDSLSSSHGSIKNEPITVTRWMDRVFLEVLRRDLTKGPEIFLRLFQDADCNAVVRFLSGVATWRDILDVVCACPKIPFLRAAMR